MYNLSEMSACIARSQPGGLLCACPSGRGTEPLAAGGPGDDECNIHACMYVCVCTYIHIYPQQHTPLVTHTHTNTQPGLTIDPLTLIASRVRTFTFTLANPAAPQLLKTITVREDNVIGSSRPRTRTGGALQVNDVSFTTATITHLEDPALRTPTHTRTRWNNVYERAHS